MSGNPHKGGAELGILGHESAYVQYAFMRPALGFTGARLYSTMALWPGAFSVRRESLLGEAPPCSVQEYLVTDDGEP